MKNPFTLLFRARDKPTDSVSNAPEFFYGTSGAGKRVTVDTAVQLSTVYACIRLISETVASLPLNVYQNDGKNNCIAEDHQLNYLLYQEPNPEMTSYTWLQVTMAHILTYGNAYSQIIRSGRNKIVSLYPLQPESMSVDRDANGALVYTYTTSEGKETTLSSLDVLHIAGLGFDGIMGYSPIALTKNTIGLSLAAEEYGSKFFANGARPSGVLKHPGRIKEFNRLRESWNNAYGGSANSNKVAILEEGVDFKPIAVPNNEAQFLETRKFQVEEICRIFRVPPHLIGYLEHSAFTSIEQQNIEFAMYTIRPWLVKLEREMNKALFSDTEKGTFFVHFNMDGLMRADYKTRMDGYAVGIQNGFFSPNDVRRMENMDPIPSELGGDRYYFNGNMIPIEFAGTQYTDAIPGNPDETDDIEQTEQPEQSEPDAGNAPEEGETNGKHVKRKKGAKSK